jgi:exodeoxyribonuclease VII large subunit
MFQSVLFTNEPLTVSEITARVKELLEGDPALAQARVTGEVSNVARPASGHLYFTLKDAGAQLKCVMWRSAAARLRQPLRNGDAVTVRGRIGVYERDGAYQMYVDALTASGLGGLHLEFERLKQQLEAEGLFDPARKRPLPLFPRALGVVTSPTAAAFQDILNVLRRRYPLVEVVLAPTLVQGDEAPPQIARAIAALNDPAVAQVDVILVARGGGSLEELWAYNDERVARAIAASRIPVVTGVGHEIDFTLADFAADVRAPTPSAAAELITPDAAELRQAVDGWSAQLDQAVLDRLGAARAQVEALRRALRALSPLSQLARARQRLEDARARLGRAMTARLALRREQARGLAARLEAVGPQATLARGYAIVRRAPGGALVRSPRDVASGDALAIRVADGEFGATVS